MNAAHRSAASRAAPLLLGAAAMAAALLWLLAPGASASSHTAQRTFSAPSVAPGAELRVTVEMAGYGDFGQLIETLPAGFAYRASDLNPAKVEVDGSVVTFTLLGEERVTYTVAAPQSEGRYTFSGVLKDQRRTEQMVGGRANLRVAAPTPAPTATPEPAATPTPRPTPTPEPTATPTTTPVPAAPTATPVPAAAPTATATPRATPTATPPPAPEPTATPAVPAAPAEPGGIQPYVWALIAIGALVVLGALLLFMLRRRSR